MRPAPASAVVSSVGVVYGRDAVQWASKALTIFPSAPSVLASRGLFHHRCEVGLVAPYPRGEHAGFGRGWHGFRWPVPGRAAHHLLDHAFTLPPSPLTALVNGP